MPSQHFADRLTAAIDQKKSRVVVGLDPVYEKLPEPLRQQAEALGLPWPEGELWAIHEFCGQIIGATADCACAFKPQIAFFERYGGTGLLALQRILEEHREQIFIVDCKRGDIGNTSEAYARAYFHRPDEAPAPLQCAAVTHNPYLGRDSIEPYMPYLAADKGMFLLARTSNPSSADFQDVLVNDIPLAEFVAGKIALWGSELIGERGYSSLGLVAGATFPEMAAVIRRLAPQCYILVPGLESQGGKLTDARHFANPDGGGAIYNFARAVIYAYASGKNAVEFGPEKYAQAARAAAQHYRYELNSALAP